MKNKHLLTIAGTAAFMLACSMTSFVLNPPTPVVTPIVIVVTATPLPQSAATDAPTVAPSAAPTTPIETATAQPTPTPSTPMITPLKDPVNCRFGPSVYYEQSLAVQVGAFALITGKSADGAWWQVQPEEGNPQKCWVADSVVISSGDLAGIMQVPAPAAIVTNVKIQSKPSSINLDSSCGGMLSPFSIKGTISVNGPVEVKWHFETQQDGRLPEHTISFSKFGSQDVSFDYSPSSWKKGKFWVRLVITSPKNMFDETNYQVNCG